MSPASLQLQKLAGTSTPPHPSYSTLSLSKILTKGDTEPQKEPYQTLPFPENLGQRQCLLSVHPTNSTLMEWM